MDSKTTLNAYKVSVHYTLVCWETRAIIVLMEHGVRAAVLACRRQPPVFNFRDTTTTALGLDKASRQG